MMHEESPGTLAEKKAVGATSMSWFKENKGVWKILSFN